MDRSVDGMTEDGVLIKRLGELAARAAYTGDAQFTRFLDPAQAALAIRAAREHGANCALWGGYPDAERAVACFSIGDAPAYTEFPLETLLIEWNAKYDSPAHRDLLGALMGLGIAREATGDILVLEGRAALFTQPELSDYLIANFESAGRAKVRLRRASGEITPPEPTGAQIRVTAPSDRLDALLAAALKLSRAEAQRRIESGLVKRNHLPEIRPDARCAPGDLLSARGSGRIRILEALGETRRGRFAYLVRVEGKPGK